MPIARPGSTASSGPRRVPRSLLPFAHRLDAARNLFSLTDAGYGGARSSERIVVDAIDYMRDEYEGRCFQYEYRVASVAEADRKTRPEGCDNSVAWVSWHMSRNEDVLINSIIGGRLQVLADGWLDRLGVRDATIGTGHDADDVTAFNRDIDVEALDAYARAVAASTRHWLMTVGSDELDAVPDVDARLTADPSMLSPAAAWVPGVWRGRNAAQMFAYFIIGHGYSHFGEIEDIRSLLGMKGL